MPMAGLIARTCLRILPNGCLQGQYGYDLAVPTTWAQLMDIAKFFTRPDKNLYGVAIYTQKDYDAITMGCREYDVLLGRQVAGSTNNNVEGVVNSRSGRSCTVLSGSVRMLPGPRPE